MSIDKEIEKIRLMLYEVYRQGMSAQNILMLSQKLDEFIVQYYHQEKNQAKNTKPEKKDNG
ncbi:Spo0E like sporulation regulatory protein [Thermosyntropha lipolytica DSM 11003]|uniref:Spo0E like sporulation regulatory protein n=1 Tax=Thermosyntropha lipolytica DSM 11003 TaxID=1123382 RepID=A0A1M5NRU0_9FIRM|nr:aspartyl-phosphate phosphatase Spo0E family protein [Thermosyntropha lipolytica]SHG92324.1 Spo0E like sporulation regulatory protein [Thermosyntropha lipolytica DSM 11003]